MGQKNTLLRIEWIMTGEAIEAFHDSSDYRTISEEEAKKAIERQNKAYENDYLEVFKSL